LEKTGGGKGAYAVGEEKRRSNTNRDEEPKGFDFAGLAIRGTGNGNPGTFFFVSRQGDLVS
jgi:hypothetical protein